MESQASPADPSVGAFDGLSRRPGERWSRFATRVANAFGLVLLLVIAIYVLSSLAPYNDWGALALAVVTSACGIVGLTSAEAGPRLLRWSIALGALGVLLAFAAALGAGGRVLAVSALAGVLLLATAAGKILGAVLTEHEVGFRTILGAISVYVLLGILFTYVYLAVDKLQPGEFFGQPVKSGDFVFFSITTLTTTGYGNLVPTGQPGKMLSGLEMLVGQIFVVTLIAGLVSLWRPGARRQARSEAAGEQGSPDRTRGP
ncbi:MAG TPA: potassium channel family protein [Gaiellaceae bacterium]|nr:potassium channel family protein [Gaiellaceae bacterium]